MLGAEPLPCILGGGQFPGGGGAIPLNPGSDSFDSGRQHALNWLNTNTSDKAVATTVVYSKLKAGKLCYMQSVGNLSEYCN